MNDCQTLKERYLKLTPLSQISLTSTVQVHTCKCPFNKCSVILIQVDLAKARYVCAVRTEAVEESGGGSESISKYYLTYTSDGRNWREYKENGVRKVIKEKSSISSPF